MSRSLTFRDATRPPARDIRDVEASAEFVISRNGTPIARVSLISKRRVLTASEQAALQGLRVASREGWNLGGSLPDRDALHER
jgi:antitoxin (DNA-binding transcriptional repressor) of toxin-antitoxin stability system